MKRLYDFAWPLLATLITLPGSALAGDRTQAGSTPPPPGVQVVKDKTGKEMVLIRPATFWMGDNKDFDDDARPAHEVRITKPYYLDRYEVTRGDFEKCVKAGKCTWPMGPRKSKIAPRGSTQRDNWGLKYCGAKMYHEPADHPLTCVNFHEAKAYCETWRGGRLPSEAEWELAARGGLDRKRFPWGDDPPTRKLAIYETYRGTMPVGTYPPNGFGLYEMAGNGWAWTADWYSGNYYRKSPKDDPRGPCPPNAEKCEGTQQHRAMRGGSWITGGYGLRVTYRNHHLPWNRFEVVGFRCLADKVN